MYFSEMETESRTIDLYCCYLDVGISLSIRPLSTAKKALYRYMRRSENQRTEISIKRRMLNESY